jgi:hypothetical protein
MLDFATLTPALRDLQQGQVLRSSAWPAFAW